MREKRSCVKRPAREACLRDLQRGVALALSGRGSSPWAAQAVKEIASLCHIKTPPLGGSVAYRIWWTSHLPQMRALADRLVARYGPTTPLSALKEQLGGAPLTLGEEREKGTDAVREAASRSGQQTHGGDGRSGEVPGGHSRSDETHHAQQSDAGADSGQVAPTASPGDRYEKDCSQPEKEEGSGHQESRAGQGTADPHQRATARDAEETGGGKTSTPQVAAVAQQHQRQGPAPSEDSAAPVQQGEGDEPDGAQEHDARRGVSGDAVHPAAAAGQPETSASRTTALAGDDAPKEPKQAGEGGEERPSEILPSPQREARQAARKLARLASGKNSRSGRNAYGGITADLAKRKIDWAIVRQAAAVLACWIASSAADEAGPRWDSPALASRLQTKRSPYPARKRDLGRPALLVLADVSGSCSGFSEKSLLVAKAIAAQGMPGCDIIVVSHSNGFPDQCEVNSRPLSAARRQRYEAARARGGGDSQEGNVAFYGELVADYQVTHVIALGDHDAVAVYTRLALSPDIQQVIWLDNYRCGSQAPRLAAPNVQLPQARANIRYVTGCKGAPEFLTGLRVALMPQA